ncbi:4Fe-4S binding protein, partial [bacterium]|nr:4Fe-4S binding protein [bacterium]
HINDHKCPAGSCLPLVDFSVIEENCTGCTLCAKDCPVNAIEGKAKEIHFIDQELCVKCGKCITSCNFNAILTQ